MTAALAILHRDARLVAVDKPAGVVTTRGWANDEDALMQQTRDAVGAWVWPIHRLDRGTSGVVLFALDVEAARALSDAFARGEADKTYLALTRGHPPEELVIDYPIPKAEGGDRVPAVTAIRRLETFGRYAWVEARPRTGRLHQIRRHLKHISCPLIGDVRYGKGEHNRLFRTAYDLHRLALHAARLVVPHPDGGSLAVDAPLAADLAACLAALRANPPAIPPRAA
ncbi:MAG: pseudouridylate synthase [Kofleriaceae bacterium]|nr:pseudouridylate synthase [Kofleriaceae bacterium]MCB9574324.1 pseudouridylate synthase [Kofleriaceae bacterium]